MSIDNKKKMKKKEGELRSRLGVLTHRLWSFAQTWGADAQTMELRSRLGVLRTEYRFALDLGC